MVWRGLRTGAIAVIWGILLSTAPARSRVVRSPPAASGALRVVLERLTVGRARRSFTANFWKLDNAASHTAVLYVHGGPFKGGSPNAPIGTRHLLLALGYDVLEPNYSGDADEVTIDAFGNIGDVHIEHAIWQLGKSALYLRRRYRNVILFGESFGGLLCSLVNQDERTPYPLILHAPVMRTPRLFYMEDRPVGILEIPAHLNMMIKMTLVI